MKSQKQALGLDLTVQYEPKLAQMPDRRQLTTWIRAVGGGPASLTIRFVAEEEGQALNAAWRGRDYATNVLSFPYETQPVLMGDLVLCWPVIEREALEQGKSVEAHTAHLVIHGILHLCGHDHEEGESQAHEMESIERDVMTRLGYADPYGGDAV